VHTEGPAQTDAARTAFIAACARYREVATTLFSDAERMDMYALYKQATLGDAPADDVMDLRSMALLRGAGRQAWRGLRGTSRLEAQRQYVLRIEAKQDQKVLTTSETTSSTGRRLDDDEDDDADEELPERPSHSSINTTLIEALNDEAAMVAPIDAMSADDARRAVAALRDRVRLLSVGRVLKAGELTRYRETMTGGDWSARWFEVVPGWLRCYRSRTNRDLRLEVALRRVTAVEKDDDKTSKRHGRRYVFRVRLDTTTSSSSKGESATPSSAIAALAQLRLSTGSREDRDEWIRGIASAARAVQTAVAAPTTTIPVASEGTGVGVPTATAAATTTGQLQQSSPAQQVAETTAPKQTSATKAAPDQRGGSSSKKPQLTGVLRPVHRVSRPSLLSSDATETQSFAGFVNLVAVVAVASNLRILIDEWHLLPWVALLDGGDVSAAAASTEQLGFAAATASLCPREVLAGWLVAALSVFASYCAERLSSSRGAATSKTTKSLSAADATHAVACCASLVVPVALLARAPRTRPVPHFFGLLGSVVAWMKHVSYAHVTSALRRSSSRHKSGDDDDVTFLAGLAQLAEFYALPTLVFQTSYPRTAAVRWRWLAKRCVELAVEVAFALVLVTQFIAPTVGSWATSEKDTEDDDAETTAAATDKAFAPSFFVERLLALAVPTLACWILMFYALFETWLSILAEVTRFADRLFYEAWRVPS